jgi:hypothetical protein
VNDLPILLHRAGELTGLRVAVRGPETHKGRVGDAIERMLLGQRHVGTGADHPLAEVKSVPVSGERVVERCKLGMISARQNPLEKCARVLFVFVEERGRDTFVAGHALHEFPRSAWLTMWRTGHLVETAAGTSGDVARGLYLTPRFFSDYGLWPL